MVAAQVLNIIEVVGEEIEVAVIPILVLVPTVGLVGLVVAVMLEEVVR